MLTCIKLNKKDFRHMESYIYAIICKLSNRVKIGFTKEPQERLKTIQIHSPTDLKLAGCILIKKAKSIVEPVLHKKLKHSRIHNEWFDYSNEDVKYVVDIISKEDKEALIKVINDYQYGVG